MQYLLGHSTAAGACLARIQYALQSCCRAAARRSRGGREVTRLVVDAMNVIGARPSGWWRDRPAAARALIARLQHLVAESGERVSVVLEGRQLPDLPEGTHEGVQLLYARRWGRDAADDRIVEIVAADPLPESLTVVTSDRALRRRVQELGAGVSGVSVLLRRLDQLRD